MENLILTSLSKEELTSIINEAINQQLQPTAEPKEDKLIKLEDVKALLNVSTATVHNWKKEGKIPFYKIGQRIYFKENEVLESLNHIGGQNEN